MRSIGPKLLLSLISALLCLVALEGAMRVMTRRDADGDLIFRSLRLPPLHAPVKKAQALLDAYQSKISQASMTYDADLGWRPTPLASGGNTDGFASSEPNPPKTPQPGKLRIALFGGSYTRGGGEGTWWRVFDEGLAKRGVKAEVLNFGVGGFAMDQALLRWRKDGIAYHPDVVIFGFSVGNSMDNMNIVRLLQNPDTGIPFTKPRFILDNGDLELINSPTVPPDQIVGHLENMADWPLLKYDHYYDPANYERHWWEASRLLSFVVAKNEAMAERRRRDSYYQMDAEAAQVALKIVQQFKRDVEAAGAKFLVIHLPAEPELVEYQAKGAFPYAELYQDVQEAAPVIQTEQSLMKVIGKGNVYSFFNDGHYGDALHEAVGETAADYIAAHAAALQPGGAK